MLLLEKVFKVINDSGLDYCIQNKYEMMPEEIPSDIDMMYRNADEQFLDSLVKKIAEETGLIITQKICQGYYEYTYIISYPCPKERFQLQLDFYRAISRRGYLNVMPAEDMLENKRFYKCFYVPDYYDELRYMWIRRTIKSDLNLEHIRIAKNIYSKSPIEYKARLQQDFDDDSVNLMLRIMESENVNLFYDNFHIFNKVVKRISRNNTNIYILYKYVLFMIATVFPKRYIHRCGISVAFLSPDGGGKTTLINRISETVSGSFYGVNKFYFRPRLLKNIGSYNVINPSYEGEINNNPHDKQIHGRGKSFIRYSFYNIDYILGTIFKVNPLKIKKQLVIFDRYYHDYFVDMKRYQYKLPEWVPTLFSFMIPKPNIIFILDGSAQVFFERKQELTVEELERQILLYRKIAMVHKNTVLINVDKPIDEVTDEVTEYILRYLENKTANIMK